MVAIGLTITIILALLGFVKKRSRSLLILQWLWFWILLGFNTGGTDFDINEYIYNQSGQVLFNGINEWLNNIFSYFAHKVGIEYWQYNCIITLLLSLLLVAFIYRVAIRPCVVMSLIYIYPLVDSVIQKRFFPSMCIMIFAFYYLKNNNKVKFLLLTFLASGFHITALIFIPLVIILDNDIFPAKIRKIAVLLLISFEVYVLLFNRSILYLISIVSDDKINSYLNSSMSRVAAFSFAASQVLYILLTKKALITNNLYSNELAKNYRFVAELNVVMLCLVPFLLINSTFSRIYRPVLVFSYIYVSDKMKGSILKNKVSSMYSFLYLGVLLVISIMLLLQNTQLIYDVFVYNKILQWL